MKYIERIPCDESKTCVNDIDDTWHKAAGPAGAGAPEYIDIQHDILYDSQTHATSEVTYNAEYPDSIIHTYRSALRTVVEQVHKKTEDAFYCYEVDGKGEETTIWNVTEAVKVGESLTTMSARELAETIVGEMAAADRVEVDVMEVPDGAALELPRDGLA